MFKNIIKVLKKRIFDVKVFSVILLLVVAVFFISDNITEKKTKLILDEKYKFHSEKLISDIKSLIDAKKEMTLTIALSLAQSQNIQTALLQNNVNLIKLKEFSKKLSQQTSFKNVWFHIIDKKGNSFYRSWIDKRGDSIFKARIDVQKMLHDPQTMSTISVGVFDMTFKSMVPIYSNDEFIGIFEIITHFNSIVQNLQQEGVEAVTLVDKKYKKQLKKAFTKTFLDDYYVANFGTKKEILDYIQSKGVESFFHNQSKYIIDKEFNKFITFYNIPDINNTPMGTIIAFKDISTINTDDIKVFKTNIIFYTVLLVIVFVLYGYYLVIRQYSKKLNSKVQDRTKELNNEKSYIQTIFDTNPSMIFVLQDEKILRANKSFLDFFGFDTLEDFIDKHKNINRFIISLNNIEFTNNKSIDKKNWSINLLNNITNDNIIKIEYKNTIYFFTLYASKLHKDEILITMHNITELRNKEELLYQQSKMASLGEMLGNIAHQWRQPLSIISTAATGMLAKKEYSILEEDDFTNSCESINTNAQYLSKTIDDFRNFIQGDSKPIKFNLQNDINEFITIVNSSIKKYEINVIVEIERNIELLGFPN